MPRRKRGRPAGPKHQNRIYTRSDRKRRTKIDKKIRASSPGRQVSKTGNVYYEFRENRTDFDRRKKL